MLNSEEFERYFNPALLDKYVVVADIQKDNGSNCENYKCARFLAIKEIEE